MNKYAAIICVLLCGGSAFAKGLEMPTLSLRMEAQQAFVAEDKAAALEKLLAASELARAQEEGYVRSNELRYIADTYHQLGLKKEAHKTFAEAMVAASGIETWNHRLYASIGILELQSRTGDLQGVRENAFAALDAGLIEVIAATGKPAEMGRFFTAMNGALTEAERDSIRARIVIVDNEGFRAKALHALNGIDVKE